MDLLCGQCGNTLKVDDSRAGGVMRCPHCSHVLRVPDLDAPAQGEAGENPFSRLSADEDLADEFLTKAKLSLKKKLLVVCGSCGERLTVQQRLAGKTSRCPACGEQIFVPSQNYEEPAERPVTVTDVQTQPEDELDLDSVPAARGAEPAEEPSGPDVQATPSLAALLAQSPTAQPVPVSVARRPIRLKIALFVTVSACVFCVVICYGLWGQPRQQPPELPAAPPPQTVVNPDNTWPPVGPGDTRPGPAPTTVVTPTPPTPPTPTPTPAPPDRPAPAKAVAHLEVQRTRLTPLSGGGLVPAPLGKTFLEVTVGIQAGEEALAFDTAGGKVTLEAGGDKIPALGLFSSAAMPLPAGQRVVNVPPTALRQETLLFLVPETITGGQIKANGLGDSPLGTLQPPAVGHADALGGIYVEAGRYLKPGFANPVMEALRTAGKLQLTLAPGPNGLRATLNPAAMSGDVKAAANGACPVTLTHGKDQLPCQLRPAEGGKLILYLRAEPYHQIIFEKQ